MTEEKTQTGWELAEGDEIAPGLSALKRLGGGHRYEAYLAWDERLHSIVVVKLVRPHLVDDDHTLAGLRAEIDMLRRLNHPVLLRSFGAETEGERPRAVLEHIEGPRLSSLIRRQSSLPAEQLIPLAMQLASALHYMSEEGVVHLDVKPANIIMSGPPRLIDLSVALDLREAASMRHPIGTDTYMAPEQCDPQTLGPVGPPADIFGLGASLYRAATNERPFRQGDPEASGVARWPQLAEDPPPLDSRRITSGLAELIRACLERRPENRPRAADVTDRLEPVLAAQSRPKLSALKPRWR